MEMDRWADEKVDRQIDCQGRQTDIHTNRQTESQADSQGRQTDQISHGPVCLSVIVSIHIRQASHDIQVLI